MSKIDYPKIIDCANFITESTHSADVNRIHFAYEAYEELFKLYEVRARFDCSENSSHSALKKIERKVRKISEGAADCVEIQWIASICCSIFITLYARYGDAISFSRANKYMLRLAKSNDAHLEIQTEFAFNVSLSFCHPQLLKLSIATRIRNFIVKVNDKYPSEKRLQFAVGSSFVSMMPYYGDLGHQHEVVSLFKKVCAISGKFPDEDNFLWKRLLAISLKYLYV